jgi:hypothetical protein
LIVAAAEKISSIRAKRNSSNALSDDRLPAVLPHELAPCILCRGLASVFPGTATVESDFSVLKWEFNEYCSSLTYISIEGIMQCKQFKKFSSIHHCSPSTAK